MASVWIDEVKEVTLKELLKPVVDYNSSVALEFHKTNDLMDLVKITRCYETTIKNKTDEVTLHQKMSTVIPCRFSSYTHEKPTSAWISGAKTFLYMLRLIKPTQYLKMEFWPSNDCDMYKKKGIQQETIVFSIIDKKTNAETFSYTYNQVYDLMYAHIPHVFRYDPNTPLPATIEQMTEKTENGCTV